MEKRDVPEVAGGDGVSWYKTMSDCKWPVLNVENYK